MEFKVDYDRAILVLRKLSRDVAKKHRDEIISDALLSICESEKSFKKEKKMSPWIRKCYNEARDNYFKKLDEQCEESYGGLRDLARAEEEGRLIT